MNVRMRKLVGTIATVAFVIVYTLTAAWLASSILPADRGAIQLVYYAVAGLAWVVPVGLMIRWMQRD